MVPFFTFKKMKQTVKREERLKVSINVAYPDLQRNKSYFDSNRNFTIEVGGKGESKIDFRGENGSADNRIKNESFRLRVQIIIRKKYRTSVDSTFIYRVGENFARLQTRGKETIVAVDFTDSNTLEVLDDCSYIKPSRILTL